MCAHIINQLLRNVLVQRQSKKDRRVQFVCGVALVAPVVIGRSEEVPRRTADATTAMSEAHTHFPPQTYSSSFFINHLSDVSTLTHACTANWAFLGYVRARRGVNRNRNVRQHRDRKCLSASFTRSLPRGFVFTSLRHNLHVKPMLHILLTDALRCDVVAHLRASFVRRKCLENEFNCDNPNLQFDKCVMSAGTDVPNSGGPIILNCTRCKFWRWTRSFRARSWIDNTYEAP